MRLFASFSNVATTTSASFFFTFRKSWMLWTKRKKIDEAKRQKKTQNITRHPTHSIAFSSRPQRQVVAFFPNRLKTYGSNQRAILFPQILPSRIQVRTVVCFAYILLCLQCIGFFSFFHIAFFSRTIAFKLQENVVQKAWHLYTEDDFEFYVDKRNKYQSPKPLLTALETKYNGEGSVAGHVPDDMYDQVLFAVQNNVYYGKAREFLQSQKCAFITSHSYSKPKPKAKPAPSISTAYMALL